MEQKKCKPCTFPVSTINRVEMVKVRDYIKKQIWQWSFDKCKCKLWYFVHPIWAIFVCCWKGQNRCVNLWSSDRENNSWEKNCRLRIPLWDTKPTQFTVICAHKLFQQLGHSMWHSCISLTFMIMIYISYHKIFSAELIYGMKMMVALLHFCDFQGSFSTIFYLR